MSGTTVACAIIQGHLAYFANVGDTGIILGKVDKDEIIAEVVTRNHKPDVEEENLRIKKLGGLVEISNNGTKRVIHPSHDDKSLSPHKLPKLNISRSLGDLWSVTDQKEYLISPIPDVYVYHLDPLIHKYIILATDGLLNMIEPQDCVRLVHEMSIVLTMDKALEIARKLVEEALDEWKRRQLNADNISIILGFYT